MSADKPAMGETMMQRAAQEGGATMDEVERLLVEKGCDLTNIPNELFYETIREVTRKSVRNNVS